MKHVFKLAILISILSGCGGSADNKAPELANEMCGCFDGFQKNLTDQEKQVMKSVSTAQNPQQEMIAAMTKFSPDASKAFAEKLKAIGDKDSEILKCLNEFDKKHGKETTSDKKALTEKLLAEMQKNGGCYVGAAIVNLNPR